MICGISLRALVRPVGNVSGRGAGRAPTPSLSVTSEAMHVSLARVAARGTGCGTRDATGPLPEMAQRGAAVDLPVEGRPFLASDRRLCHCPPMRSKCNEQTHGSNMWNGVASTWFSSCCLKSKVRNRTVRIGAGGPCLAPVAGVEIRHLGSRGVAASVTSPGTTLL